MRIYRRKEEKNIRRIWKKRKEERTENKRRWRPDEMNKENILEKRRKNKWENEHDEWQGREKQEDEKVKEKYNIEGLERRGGKKDKKQEEI